jgi:hypothetical protein
MVPYNASDSGQPAPETAQDRPKLEPVKTSSLPFGLDILLSLPANGAVLFVTRCIRLFAYGAFGFCLALYLQQLGLSDTEIGTVFSMTLLGHVVFSWLITRYADHGLGRKRSLVVSSLFMALAGTPARFSILTTSQSLQCASYSV